MDKNTLLEELQKIEANISAGPWNEGALEGAIRHVQRNTEIFEDIIDCAEADEPKGAPDRYDGGDLAKLRNLLPSIIEFVGKQ